MRNLIAAAAVAAVLPLSACGHVHHHHTTVYRRTTVVGGGVGQPLPVARIPQRRIRVCSYALRRNRFGRLVRVKVCR